MRVVDRSDSDPAAGFARLAQRRHRARFGHTILWRARTDSTNAWVRRLAAGGVREGVVAVADGQETGRGRHGRPWESPGGLGLYCSLLVRPRLPHEQLGLLPLAAGVAAAAAVRRLCRIPALLQWPNDLVAGTRKLGGVLVETSMKGGRVQASIVGWGLNLGQRRSDFSTALRRRATSLRLLRAAVPGRAALLSIWLSALERCLARLERGETLPLLRRFGALSPSARGARLVVQIDGRRCRALSCGLEPDGSLRVELPQGERILRSAEVLRVLGVEPCSS